MGDSKRSIFKSPLLYSTLIAIVVSVFGYYQISYKETKKTEKESQIDKNITVKTTTEIDSDKDGLPNWKEAVYSSDPNNKDTDGDGMLDGAEINIGHDPTRKGPDDFLHNISLKNSTSTTTDDPEKAFVAEFMSKEIENTGSEIVANMLKEFDTSQLKPRYNLQNLNVDSDNSKEKLKAYADEFGIIIKKYTSDGIESESKIMEESLKTRKQSDLQKIELPAIEYRNFSEDLKKLPVPSALAEDHLKIVSGYDVMSRSLFLTEQLFTNPIAGGAGWQTYLTQILTVNRGYAGIIRTLNEKGVYFDKADPGYYFDFNNYSISTTTQIINNTN